MSTAAINNVVENSGIGTGNMLIHYDFLSYGGEIPRTHVLPASGCGYDYSGRLFGFPDHTPTEPVVNGLSYTYSDPQQILMTDHEMPVDFTVLCWMYPYASPPQAVESFWGTSLAIGTDPKGTRCLHIASLNRFQFRVSNDENGYLLQTPTGVVPKESWSHYAARFSSVSGMGLIFNGSVVVLGAAATGTGWRVGNDLQFGQILGGNAFYGKIASGYLFSGYLSNSEISGIAYDYGFAQKAFSGISGLAQFSGGYNDANQYIQIQNSESIYDEGFLDSEEFTMLFRANHLTRFDIGLEEQEPLNSKDIVFSNLVGEGNCVSGWEVGLNAANKLYFKTTSELQPVVFSYADVPYGDNIWAVRYSNPSVTISRYEPFDDSLKNSSVFLREPLSNGGAWTIGSGNGMIPTDDSISDGRTSAMNLSNFMFFNSYVSDNNIRNLSLAMLGELSTDTSSSQIYISGVSGFSYESSSVSGTIYESGVLSGYAMSSTGSVTFNRATEIYGGVDNGNAYFERLAEISGLSAQYLNETEWIYQTLLNTGSLFTGITGLQYDPVTVQLSGLVPVYYFSGVSGEIGSGVSLSYSLSGESSNLSSSVFGTSSVNRVPVYPKSFSYLGDRQSGDFVEIISGANSYLGRQILNADLDKRRSSVFAGQTLSFNHAPDMSQANVFINGLYSRYGELTKTESSSSRIVSTSVSGQEIIISCDGEDVESVTYPSNALIVNGRVVTLDFDKDFSLTGLLEIVAPYDFSSTSESRNLFGVADFLQSGARQELVITDVSQYAEAPFYEFVPTGHQVFFNGQKIYEGVGFSNYFQESALEFTVEGSEFPSLNGIYVVSGVDGSYSKFVHKDGLERTITAISAPPFANVWSIKESGDTKHMSIIDGSETTDPTQAEWTPPLSVFAESYLFPEGSITGMTGIFSSIPDFVGGSSTTGEMAVSGFGFFSLNGVYFQPKSNVPFLNGIRVPLANFVEHDISKDLISGVKIQEKGLGYEFSTSFSV